MSASPTHHQMVRSLRTLVRSMEELARKSGIPVKRLWDAYEDENTTFRTWKQPLETYYYKRFPECQFTAFVQRRDQKLQDAFQLAVSESNRDPSKLRELIEDDWTWLSSWRYEDKADEHYLRARYALMSGWANIRLAPEVGQEAALVLAVDESALSLAALEEHPERPMYLGLRMKVARTKISAAQRLHLLKHKKHLSVTQTLGRHELQDLAEYLLSQVKAWAKGHFNRWQLARDAVTISSGLSMLDECSQAYEILLEERPVFADPDHPEWTVGPAADDPDLKFFRDNLKAIRKLIMERNKLCAA